MERERERKSCCVSYRRRGKLKWTFGVIRETETGVLKPGAIVAPYPLHFDSPVKQNLHSSRSRKSWEIGLQRTGPWDTLDTAVF